MTHMEINNIFGNRMCWRIVSFFIQNPSHEFSQVSIVKQLKITKVSASKWLKLIERYGVTRKKYAGRTHLYSLNRDNPVVKQIKILYNVSRLIPELSSIRYSEIYLFGSASRGEDDGHSDIDILVIGKDSSVIKKIRKIEKKIKVTYFTPMDWSRMSRKDPAFYERVEKDKIELVKWRLKNA